MLENIPIIGKYFKKTNTAVSDFEAYLLSKGCIIMPFGTFLSNPNMPILTLTSVDVAKAYIDRWSAVMTIKAVYKQGTSYYLFNTSDGWKLTI